MAGVALKAGWYLHMINRDTLLPTLRTNRYVLMTLVMGGLLGSLVALAQVDLKRWIAVYSIGHMNVLYAIWVCG